MMSLGKKSKSKQAVGDFNIPQHCPSNPQLGRWVQTQRLEKKNKKLSKERCATLNSIGFNWVKHPERCNGNNGHYTRQKEALMTERVVQRKTSTTVTDNDEIGWDGQFRELPLALLGLMEVLLLKSKMPQVPCQ
jgi:hypothetical protein